MRHAVWGLPQAGILVNKLLRKRLLSHGYYVQSDYFGQADRACGSSAHGQTDSQLNILLLLCSYICSTYYVRYVEYKYRSACWGLYRYGNWNEFPYMETETSFRIWKLKQVSVYGNWNEFPMEMETSFVHGNGNEFPRIPLLNVEVDLSWLEKRRFPH
jgi:hypothetical protein